ncbi:MAG: putative exporter, partial [Francisellaceae bacterium]
MKTNIATKIRFICWIIAVIILLAYFIRTIFMGFPLNTNVLDLLPKSNESPITATAVDTFSQTMGNQLIFLVGNPNKTTAQKASDNFYHGVKYNKLFKKITYEINSQEQQAWAGFYFPYRMSLLTKIQRTELQNNQADRIEQAAIFNLYSPMGFTNTDLLKKDPFSLFQKFITSIPKPASKIELVNQKMMVQSDGIWYVMLNIKLSGDSFSISNQDSVVNAINSSKSNMLKLYPKTT